MGILASVGGYVDGGPGEDGEINPMPTEHHHTMYFDLSDIGAVSGGGAASGSTGNMEITGTGRPGLGR